MMKKINRKIVVAQIFLSISLGVFLPSFRSVKAFISDITPPSIPQQLGVTSGTDSTATLGWQASADFVDPLGVSYNIYVNGSFAGTSAVVTYTATGLQPRTAYTFTVASKDSSGNVSGLSNIASYTTDADMVKPVVNITYPASGAVINGGATFIATSTDDVGVAGVQFMVDGQNYGNLSTAAPYSVSFNGDNFTKNSGHNLTAVAYDTSGNIAVSAPVSFTTGNPAAPAPYAISVGQISSTSAVIAWQTSVGATGAVKYGLDSSYGQQAQEPGPTSQHSVGLTGLLSGKTYHFSAQSMLAGYLTASSTDVTFTTLDASAQSNTAPPIVPVANNNPANAAAGAHPDGTLILDGSTVYLIKNGNRAPFRDPAEYQSYGYQFTQAVAASQQDKLLPLQSDVMKALEGTLVLDKADNKTVYMVGTNGTKRGFSGETVFKGLGYKFENLAAINMGDYPAGAAITSASEAHPDGALVLEAKTVWWIRGAVRQGFESAAVFNTYGFSFSKIVPANAADLALPVGSPVKLRDGTLVRQNGSTYIISNGQKLQFASQDALAARGYSITNAISADISGYPSGAALQ